MSYGNTLNYLADNIGFVTDLGQVDNSKMPFYLKSEFEFHRIDFLGKRLILAELLIDSELTIDRLKNRRSKLNQFINTDETIVFVFDDITSYLRKRLIEEKISFVILGKAIFILELGTVFSERTVSKYTRQVNLKKDQMKPVTQALLLYLLRTQDFSSSMADIAHILSVSRMSVFRAFNELNGFSFIISTDESEKESYKLNGKRSEVWKMAMPFMINPVIKTVYMDPDNIDEDQISHLILSGESALSRYSMLSEPSNEVFGIHKTVFKDNFKEVTLSPIRERNSLIVQVFSHVLFSKDECLDELSTALVLMDEVDERVRGEVDGMLNNYFGDEVTNGQK